MGKKKKNKDFQKVKLKLGRKLQRGTNVTDTSFKAKKISVVQNLHKKGMAVDFNEAATIRKESVNYLLQRLAHYNASIRLETLNRLKTLLTGHTGLIVTHFTALVDKIPLLATDNDGSVRKVTLSIIKIMLQNISKEKLTSVYSVLAAELCCAMSHLNPNVQFDSMFFLDILLEYCPNLILIGSSSILPNFVNQISKPKSSNGSERVLAMDPSTNFTSQTWRKNIFLRLNNVLKIVLNSDFVEDGKIETIHWTSCHSHVVNSFDYEKVNARFSMKNLQQTQTPYDVSKFLSEVLPLLFETWIEVAATQSQRVNGIVNPNDLSTLECILGIFYQFVLYTNVCHHDNLEPLLNIKSDISQNFITVFYNSFPFSFQSQFRKLKTKKREKRHGDTFDLMSNEHTCVQINLMICYVMLSITHDISHYENDVGALIQYLSNVLQSVHLTPKHINLIISIIKMMVKERLGCVEYIFLNFLHALERMELNSGFFNILRYICDFLRVPSNLNSDQINFKLLRFLADKIKQGEQNTEFLSISIDIFSTILKSKKNDFSDCISSCFIDLLVAFGNSETEDWRKACNLFYWCNFDENFLEQFTKLKRSGFVSAEFASLFLKFLRLRQERMTLPVSHSVYFKFLFSILVEPFESSDVASEEVGFLQLLTTHWGINIDFNTAANLSLDSTLPFTVSKAFGIFNSENSRILFDTFLHKIHSKGWNITAQSYLNILHLYSLAGLNEGPIPNHIIVTCLFIIAFFVQNKKENYEIFKILSEILSHCDKRQMFHHFSVLLSCKLVDVSFNLLKSVLELFRCLLRLNILLTNDAQLIASLLAKKYLSDLQNIREWKIFLCEINFG